MGIDHMLANGQLDERGDKGDEVMSIRFATSAGARLLGLGRLRGFRGMLVLAPCRDIHTYGMRRPIDAAFVTDTGLVAKSVCRIAPRRRIRCPSACMVIERFSADSPWFKEGDLVGLLPIGRDVRTGIPPSDLITAQPDKAGR